jgi:hypothetical protein
MDTFFQYQAVASGEGYWYEAPTKTDIADQAARMARIYINVSIFTHTTLTPHTNTHWDLLGWPTYVHTVLYITTMRLTKLQERSHLSLRRLCRSTHVCYVNSIV